MTTTTDLGHETRLSVWAEISADEVYERRYRTEIDNAVTAADIDRARFRLTAVEAHEAQLWDSIANLQAL